MYAHVDNQQILPFRYALLRRRSCERAQLEKCQSEGLYHQYWWNLQTVQDLKPVLRNVQKKMLWIHFLSFINFVMIVWGLWGRWYWQTELELRSSMFVTWGTSRSGAGGRAGKTSPGGVRTAPRGWAWGWESGRRASTRGRASGRRGRSRGGKTTTGGGTAPGSTQSTKHQRVSKNNDERLASTGVSYAVDTVTTSVSK